MFRPCHQKQELLLPTALQDWLREDHFEDWIVPCNRCGFRVSIRRATGENCLQPFVNFGDRQKLR